MSETPPVEAAVPDEAPHLSSGRRIGIWVLILIGFLLALVSVLAIWINRVALDEDTYTDTMSQVLENENVQSVLSVYLVDQLYDNVDVAGELEARLPEDTKALAAPLAGGLRQVAVPAAERALGSDAVQTIWTEANRRAHQRLLLLLEDEGEFVSTTNGEVTLDLRDVVLRVGERVGLGARLDEQLPPDAGQIEIIQSDELGAAQTMVRILKFLAYFVWVFAFLAWGLALFLARGRRRQTLRAIALAFLVLGLFVLLIRRIVGNRLVDRLVENESVRPAIRDVWSILTETLASSAQTIVIVSVVALLGTWLAGGGGRVTALRRWLAPYFRERVALVYGVAAAVFLILILWAPTQAFRRPTALVVMALLAVLGIEVLRRLTHREFPDAEYTPVGLGDRVASWREGRTPAAGATPAPDPRTAQVEGLAQLAELHSKGALTDEEFAAAKASQLAEH